MFRPKGAWTGICLDCSDLLAVTTEVAVVLSGLLNPSSAALNASVRMQYLCLLHSDYFRRIAYTTPNSAIAFQSHPFRLFTSVLPFPSALFSTRQSLSRFAPQIFPVNARQYGCQCRLLKCSSIRLRSEDLFLHTHCAIYRRTKWIDAAAAAAAIPAALVLFCINLPLRPLLFCVYAHCCFAMFLRTVAACLLP